MLLCTGGAPDSFIPLLWNGNLDRDGFCIGAKNIRNSKEVGDFFSCPREKEGDPNDPKTGGVFSFIGGKWRGTIVPSRGV